jgi:hypothetical protein
MKLLLAKFLAVSWSLRHVPDNSDFSALPISTVVVEGGEVKQLKRGKRL